MSYIYGDEKLWNRISKGALDFVNRNYSYKSGKGCLRRLLNSVAMSYRADEMFEVAEIQSQSEFIEYLRQLQSEYERHEAIEEFLIGDLSGFEVEGYCAACRQPSTYRVGFEYALEDKDGNIVPNWCEQMSCGKLYEDPDLRHAIGANGRAFAQKYLQWDITAPNILSFIKNSVLHMPEHRLMIKERPISSGN